MKNIKFTLLAATLIAMIACSKDASDSGDTGTGGSMARFTIKGNFLYTVDHKSLHTFDISAPNNVSHLYKQNLGFGIETIFPTENHLFIGARNGMHIYELSNPSRPSKKSFTPHFVSYDPVVVQGDFAYVTLRSDENFGTGRNLLQIYDISKLSDPVLLSQHNMVGPRGLGIDGDKLFICDNVLKVFKVTNGDQIQLIKTFNIQAIDVIPENEKLYVVAEDGFYQYSYNDDNIEFLSKITLPEKQKP
jgi:hypothetical protein